MSHGRQHGRATTPHGAQRGTGRSLVRVVEVSLWLGVAGLFLWRIAPQVEAAAGWNAGGTSAPAVTLDMLDGRALRLPDLRGQVVLVNFWATWCPPCRAEMPGFQKVYDAKRAAGFTVLGISMDELPRRDVAGFLHDHAITYPVAMATRDAVVAFGGINSFPTSFLIDRQGRVRYTVQGIFAEPTLRAAVDRLLAEGD
jgi:cytochrome c biogenesis protein CcmG/thiol:disulfide interchange protein DsbE